jgi:hypothetical protein
VSGFALQHDDKEINCSKFERKSGLPRDEEINSKPFVSAKTFSLGGKIPSHGLKQKAEGRFL